MSHYADNYEFGPYQFDLARRVLTRAGESISLTPKATEILVLLLANAGQLVERDEILKEVWPDSFVEESNLSQNIFILRRVFGDDRTEPKYIETVAKRGYRFIAQVKAVSGDGEQSNSLQTRSKRDYSSQHPVIAVLPFLNATDRSDLNSLTDGITDIIINNLSRVPQLRVMSHSAVDRYRMKVVDPQKAGQELLANAVLVGRLNARQTGVSVSVELVDPATGWQLWGDAFDSDKQDVLEIQNEITVQLLANLKPKLIGNGEKRVTARYTDSNEAYSAYLEGRQHWCRHTRKSLEESIRHFRRAIELDPNYALAYAAIVDSYLRLATNYLPPEDELILSESESLESKTNSSNIADERIALRFEWDWRGVERELRRANDLKIDYPRAHQWYFAYQRCKQLYEDSIARSVRAGSKPTEDRQSDFVDSLPPQITSMELTAGEQLQVLCAIARDQIDVGNCEAACKILEPWWTFGNSPRIEGLNQISCADLLFTAGQVAGYVATSVHLLRGQRHSEQLLNGSIALFEQLGFAQRALEARISLAWCFHRQGLFDLARSTLAEVLEAVSEENRDLRSLTLMRIGSLERDAGRVKDALIRLEEALTESCGPWVAGRCYLELASTHKDLAITEDSKFHFNQAMDFYTKGINQLAAVGHHRYEAVVENNIGLLLLGVKAYEESERHLLRARGRFEVLSDSLRGAQVNDTLTRLYIETQKYAEAQEAIDQAIKIFELADGEMMLVDALTTAGILAVKQQQHIEAKKSFEAACRVAEWCGDNERAGQALLIMFEELCDRLEFVENVQIVEKIKRLLATTQQTNLHQRVEKCTQQLAHLERMKRSISDPKDSLH